jgi:hypothetical protein
VPCIREPLPAARMMAAGELRLEAGGLRVMISES